MAGAAENLDEPITGAVLETAAGRLAAAQPARSGAPPPLNIGTLLTLRMDVPTATVDAEGEGATDGTGFTGLCTLAAGGVDAVDGGEVVAPADVLRRLSKASNEGVRAWVGLRAVVGPVDAASGSTNVRRAWGKVVVGWRGWAAETVALFVEGLAGALPTMPVNGVLLSSRFCVPYPPFPNLKGCRPSCRR